MISLDELQFKKIAFNLICSGNQKAKQQLYLEKIGPEELPNLGNQLLSTLGFKEAEIRIIKKEYEVVADRELQLALANNIQIVFDDEEDYPPNLKEIFDPPRLLYCLGDKSILNSPQIAVVGSRRASKYGWFCLNQTLPALCRAGITIVSGMAYGIDSMAHNLALQSGGKTIGVNAGGLLHLTPPGNRGLIDAIGEKGCIISEIALNTIPRPFYFPIRNRIIAGISKGVLVAEAALRSGSLITARLALEQNRDIYSFPGRIDSPVSTGTNYLIQQGAKLITCAKDILDEYGISQPPEEVIFADLSKKEKKILDLMPVNELKGIDYFVDQVDYSVSGIISLLMGLILKNIVIEESGGYRRIR